MSVAKGPTIDPIVLAKDEGQAVWFLSQLAVIKASGATTGGRMALIEYVAPQGGGSPLHVHQREDEWFYVQDGALTFWIGGRVVQAPAGSFVYGPRGIPHTFTVASANARFLLGVEPAGFENFVQAVGEPAKALTLPPPPSAPPDFAKLARIAAEYGIEILGPPGIPT